MRPRARSAAGTIAAGVMGFGKAKALSLLLQAQGDASDVGCSVWEFAVELGCFRREGVSHSDLRWLLQKGYALHRVEKPNRRGRRRIFGRVAGLSFSDRSCFVPTAAGLAAARRTDPSDLSSSAAWKFSCLPSAGD